jgi:hypothetical protein
MTQPHSPVRYLFVYVVLDSLFAIRAWHKLFLQLTAVDKRRRAMEYDNTRGMTVHFMDGSRMRFVGPKQAKDDWDAIRKMQLILDRPYLCLETEDSAIIIPMANVKYIQSSPKPPSLPEFFLKNTSLVED